MGVNVRRGIVALAAVAALAAAGCSKPDVKDEALATVNGETIKVSDLREFLGLRGIGAASAVGMPDQAKKDALDRLIAGRLIAQEARAQGLDNTNEFREIAKRNEQSVLINALFRREVASKLKVSDSDVKAEAKKLREADKTLSEDNASLRAGRIVSETQMRKLEEDIIAAAKKDVPSTINQDAVGKIGKTGKVPDDTVLATVGDAKVSYADVKAILAAMTRGSHGGQDLATNPVAVGRVLDREVAARAVAAYARKSGIEGSEWAKAVRQDMERSIAIDLLAEKAVIRGIQVTDREIQDAYAEHASTFVRDGKKVPLSQVKEQLKAYLRNEKQRKAMEAYIADLKKKAKITVNEALLTKV